MLRSAQQLGGQSLAVCYVRSNRIRTSIRTRTVACDPILDIPRCHQAWACLLAMGRTPLGMTGVNCIGKMASRRARVIILRPIWRRLQNDGLYGRKRGTLYTDTHRTHVPCESTATRSTSAGRTQRWLRETLAGRANASTASGASPVEQKSGAAEAPGASVSRPSQSPARPHVPIQHIPPVAAAAAKLCTSCSRVLRLLPIPNTLPRPSSSRPPIPPSFSSSPCHLASTSCIVLGLHLQLCATSASLETPRSPNISSPSRIVTPPKQK